MQQKQSVVIFCLQCCGQHKGAWEMLARPWKWSARGIPVVSILTTGWCHRFFEMPADGVNTPCIQEWLEVAEHLECTRRFCLGRNFSTPKMVLYSRVGVSIGFTEFILSLCWFRRVSFSLSPSSRGLFYVVRRRALRCTPLIALCQHLCGDTHEFVSPGKIFFS